MTTLAPVSVALKFGFLAVLYLFLLWVARSALKDLRGAGDRIPTHPGGVPTKGEAIAPDATGLYSASTLGSADIAHRAPKLGGERAEIRLEDPFASSRHARVYEQGNIVVIEDLGSTNGTYLNEELLETGRPLHPGDRVRIGDSEFTFEVD